MRIHPLLILFPLTLAHCPVATAQIDPSVHKTCSDVKDYAGCIKAHSQEGIGRGATGNNVVVPKLEDFSYEKDSIRQLKIRGQYGRYLTFIGRTKNKYEGTSGVYLPGTPGIINCTTTGGSIYLSTTCSESGGISPTYIPPTSGGTQQRRFRYELDCQDQTYNRIGDRKTGIYKKGWMDIGNDPVARDVARKYCPIIKKIAIYGSGASVTTKKETKGWKSRWGELRGELIDQASLNATNKKARELLGQDKARWDLTNSQDVDKAIEIYNYRLADFPEDPRLLWEKAWIYFKAQRWDEAHATYELILKNYPNMDLAVTNNRYALNQLGRFDEALNFSIRATELLPKDPLYRRNRAVDTYLSSGKKRFEDSIEACRQLKIAIQLGYKQNESERKLFKNCS